MKKNNIIQDLKVLIKHAKELEAIEWNAGKNAEMRFYAGQANAYQEILNRIEARRY